MNKTAIKDMVYGGLKELINNRTYYYHSSVGQAYSHLTDEGRNAVADLMNIVAWQILQAEAEDLDLRARQQVIDHLKS